MKFDEKGRELPDPTPMELPSGFRAPESLESMIARMVRGRISQLANDEGMETFEEANDFELGDEEDLLTPSEEREMKLEALREDQLRLKELEDGFAEEAKAAKLRESIERRAQRKRKKAAEEPPPEESTDD